MTCGVGTRLRDKVASAIADSNRAVSEVAAEYGVSWPTAHKALVAAAAHWLPEPEPTAVLGIDETRFRSVRWILDGITWKRSDPWLTCFVDCSRDGPGSLLGLAPGRTGACVREWLGEQIRGVPERDRDRGDRPVRAVRLRDPRRAAGRQDRGRQVASGRARQPRWSPRSGSASPATCSAAAARVADPVWVNRRLLLTGAEHLSRQAMDRLQAMLDSCDPTKEIGAAWAVKERLRLLLGEREPSKIRWRLADFYDAAIDAATARDHPTRQNHPDLVASHPGRAHRGRHQRPHRRLQPDHQTNQASRLRLPQHDQLPAPYPQPHRGHPTAEISSMNGHTPLKFEEPPMPHARLQSRRGRFFETEARDYWARIGHESDVINFNRA